MGLILDTSEFIFVERQGGSVQDVVRKVGDDQFSGISVITIAELQHGVRRADGERRRRQRTAFLDDVIHTFEVIPLSVQIAMRVGDLDAYLEIRGEPIELPDLIIAATALALDLEVATRNTSHFERIPQLRLAQPL